MTLVLNRMFAPAVNARGDRRGLSSATLDHARLTFEEALSELRAMVEAIKTEPSFEVAVDLCLATRTAWLIAFPEWRIRGDEIHADLTEMDQLLTDALIQLKSLQATSKLSLEKGKLARFSSNVGWRLEMAKLITNTKLSHDVRLRKLIDLESEKK